MGRLRQLPQFYLRGAIANETMKCLPRDEQKRIDILVRELSSSPLMAGHRGEFINKLSKTIGGDYRDDRNAADAEFKIAVWRAVVYLIHHASYSFKCIACQASTYLTQRGRPKVFDRRYPVCPNCNKVETNPGVYQLFQDVQRAQLGGAKISYQSTIEPKKGDRKVADYNVVLADKEQLGKFMSEFIWNYYRQILRENEIRYHDKLERTVAGPADQIAVEEVLSTLSRVKFPHVYQPNANPQNGFYTIHTDLDCANATLIERLLALIIKYERFKVKIKIADHNVMVQKAIAHVPAVEALIIKPQVVALLTNPARIGGDIDDSTSIIDLNHHRIVGGKLSMQEDGIAKIEADDLLATIRHSLPEGAQKILEIFTQTGETWQRFSLPTQQAAQVVQAKEETIAKPTNRPSPAQIAKFLNVSPKQTKQWISDIRVQCLAKGLVPCS